MTRKVLVTGGAGFIGSAFVRRTLNATEFSIVNVDKLTYAASPEALSDVASHPRYGFEKADIADAQAMRRILRDHRPDAIINLAAETHVDRSIDGPADFIRTNVVGTFTLLEAALDYWTSLKEKDRTAFRFVQVSTDEVFGSLGPDGRFSADSPHRPNSPYAASKASADHLTRAWFRTYGLPTVTSHSSNNYGPFQFPEKLIPLVVDKALAGEPIPVYGKGENVRDWLFVEDHADALLVILDRGTPGETYLVGGQEERTNLDVVRSICRILDELQPSPGGKPYERSIAFVADRPGHDFRYAVDCSKVTDSFGWRPRHDFESGLRRTLLWYLANRDWRRRIGSSAGVGDRLGLRRTAG